MAVQSPLDGTIGKPRTVSLDSNVRVQRVKVDAQTGYTYSAIEKQLIVGRGWVYTNETKTAEVRSNVSKWYYDDKQKTPPISDLEISILKQWGLSVVIETVPIIDNELIGTYFGKGQWGDICNVTADVSPVSTDLGLLFSDLNSMIRFHSNSGNTTQRQKVVCKSVWNSDEDGQKLWGDPTYPAAAGAHPGVFSNNAVAIKTLMEKQAQSIHSDSGSDGTAVPCNFVPGQSIFQSPINALHYAMAYAEAHTFGDGATFRLLRVTADGEPKVIGTNVTTVATPTAPPGPGIIEFGMATIEERPAWRPILRVSNGNDTHLIDTDDFTRWGKNIITTHKGIPGTEGNASSVAPGKKQLRTDESGGGYIIVLVPGQDMGRGEMLYELYKAYDLYNPKTRQQFDQLLKRYYEFAEWKDPPLAQIGTFLTGTDDPGGAQTRHNLRTRLFEFVKKFSEDSLRSTYIGKLVKERNPLEDRKWIAAAKFALTDKDELDILGDIEARKACDDIMQQLKQLLIVTGLISTDSSVKTYGFYIEYGNASAPEIIFKKVNNDAQWFGLGKVTAGNDPLARHVNEPLKTYEVLSNGTLKEIVQRVIPADEADTETRSSLWAPLNDYIPSIEFDDDVRLVLFSGGALTLVYYTFA